MLKLMLLTFITVFAYAKAPLPVTYANIKAFSGLWYEIARTENKFQEKCVASSVEYVLKDPKSYKVYNRCFDTKIGGELIEYKGSAEPSQGDSVSELEMTYFWVFTKEYRIIYLEKDYSGAVVTDEDMKSVWIMSRKPTMKKEKLDTILAILKPHMDLSKLIFTPQDKEGRYK